MTKNKKNFNDKLVGENATEPGIDQSWKQDNQAWWDWYVTLAHNPDNSNNKSLLNLPPLPNIKLPSDNEIEIELSRPYKITKAQSDMFLNEIY